MTDIIETIGILGGLIFSTIGLIINSKSRYDALTPKIQFLVNRDTDGVPTLYLKNHNDSLSAIIDFKLEVVGDYFHNVDEYVGSVKLHNMLNKLIDDKVAIGTKSDTTVQLTSCSDYIPKNISYIGIGQIIKMCPLSINGDFNQHKLNDKNLLFRFSYQTEYKKKRITKEIDINIESLINDFKISE